MRLTSADMSPDAAISFLMQQTTHIEAEVYRTEYPQFQYALFVPLDNSAPEWSDSVAFQAVDAKGELQLIGPQSTDVPTVDIARSVGFHGIKTAALGYTFTLIELNQAKLAGTSLDTERAVAVRDIVEEGMNKIYLLGNNGVGEGLYTSSNVSVSNAASTIPAMIAAIPTHGTQPILTFFAQALNTIYIDQTKTIHKANTIILPVTDYTLLETTMLDTRNSSNLTVLEFLKLNLKNVSFESDILLESQGAGQRGRMVVYKKDKRVVKGHDTMPLRFLAPGTSDNLNFRVASIVRTGGTEWRIPAAGHYVDGVSR